VEYGGSQVIEFNGSWFGKSNVNFPPWLERDVLLIEKTSEIGFFYYAPPMWRLGGITHLEQLQSEENRTKASTDIVSAYPSRTISRADTLFRVRANPMVPSEPGEYDSPPAGSGRMNADGLAIWYCSQDLEICLHECRVTIADRLFMARLRPLKDLLALDLTAEIDESGTPFESLNIAMRMIFSAEKHAYPLIREITKQAKEAGFDGVIYPSYFSRVRPGIVPNIAIFGHPVSDKLLSVECINRVHLKEVNYTATFGPALPSGADQENS